METTRIAITKSGKRLPYVVTDNPPRGGMKYTYFAPDRSYVIQFYNNPADADYNTRSRIEAIIGRYNPTRSEADGGAIGTDENVAKYYSKRYCWPSDIVVSPEFGIVAPAYPKNFFFDSAASDVLNLYGRDKKSNWFTSSNRRFLHKSELGDFRTALACSILLARSVRRLHQAGLAHSDLSNNNVLIDPPSGDCCIIDIDSLVVPGLYPPEVAGTRGYIAPEVVATMDLDRRDPRRVYPSAKTDLHALAVLIYEYFFHRHPLIGPKINSTLSAEEDDRASLGKNALFIEHPGDRSNRPANLGGNLGGGAGVGGVGGGGVGMSGGESKISDLGVIIEKLFTRAFVDGLHSPSLRPSALEWERGLVRSWELLSQCDNKSCRRFYIKDDGVGVSGCDAVGGGVSVDGSGMSGNSARGGVPACPFCGHDNSDKNITFRFYSDVHTNPGEYRYIYSANISDNTPLFIWHFCPNIIPDEKTDKTLMAYVIKHSDSYYLVNARVKGLCSPDGRIIPPGRACRLSDGDKIFSSGLFSSGGLIAVSIDT